ncbi:MAG: ATP-binding protein [Muribaculaceae bacterium]|nr:ATP-binding protein [Muribaculaceae bacterium]
MKCRLPKHFERITKTDQFILDDFGMKRLNTEQVLDLMEIIKERHGRHATSSSARCPSQVARDL